MEYSKETFNILKKDRLSHAKKQFFAKKLIEQSAYLYQVEMEIELLKQVWQVEISYT